MTLGRPLVGPGFGAAVLPVGPSHRMARQRTWSGGREQHITTVWTPCRFGGKRPWFQCGGCGRRVVRLYIVQAVIACRHCHRLGYASQLEAPQDRGAGRARRIRLRLSGDDKDDPSGKFPSRPRFMHRRTYERWRRTHDDAEERSAMGLTNFVERPGRRSRVAG
jgi:hypothetical protein